VRKTCTWGHAWRETETLENQIVCIGASGLIDPAELKRNLLACLHQDNDAG
jgi:hypothetical protein